MNCKKIRHINKQNLGSHLRNSIIYPVKLCFFILKSLPWLLWELLPWFSLILSPKIVLPDTVCCCLCFDIWNIFNSVLIFKFLSIPLFYLRQSGFYWLHPCDDINISLSFLFPCKMAASSEARSDSGLIPLVGP